jgi:hypothetical protein
MPETPVQGVTGAQWSPDGRRLALVTPDGLRILFALQHPELLPDRPDAGTPVAPAPAPAVLPEADGERANSQDPVKRAV